MVIQLQRAKLHLSCCLACISFIVSASLFGQRDLILLDSLQVKGNLIAVDRLNQLYLLTEEDQLWKTNPQGQLQFQFSDNTLGPLTEIDVSNPFNILVFYRAFQLAKVLDRTLNPNVEFDFGALNFFNVQSLANGIDNTVWIYDQQEGKIFQLDANGKILNQSQDLIFIIGSRPDSCELFFHKNELWLQVDEVGLLKFNAFGQYLRTVRWEKKMEQVAFWQDRLIFRSEKKWYVLDEVAREIREITYPFFSNRSSNTFFNSDYVFIQRKKTIYRYKN